MLFMPFLIIFIHAAYGSGMVGAMLKNKKGMSTITG